MTDKNCIHVSGVIGVNKDAASAFAFFANPANDHLWRTEINKSMVQGPLQAGATVVEYAYLSKKAANHLLKFQCVQFENNKLAIFETGHNAPFYQKSQRRVKAVSATATELVYTLDFDINVVKFALGFNLPRFLVAWKANSDLKKYLRQLKKQLEST